jgi:hypothetical protein
MARPNGKNLKILGNILGHSYGAAAPIKDNGARGDGASNAWMENVSVDLAGLASQSQGCQA